MEFALNEVQPVGREEFNTLSGELDVSGRNPQVMKI
jgi:hypothetical protein